MKKVVYLWVLLVLSLLATASRVFSSFFAGEPTLTKTGNAATDAALKQSFELVKLQHLFVTSPFARVLAVLMIVALLVSLFYLIKKDIKAVYAYGFYLLLTLLESIISFVYISKAGTASVFGLATSVVLFLIFFGIVYFKSKGDRKGDHLTEV